MMRGLGSDRPSCRPAPGLATGLGQRLGIGPVVARDDVARDLDGDEGRGATGERHEAVLDAEQEAGIGLRLRAPCSWRAAGCSRRTGRCRGTCRRARRRRGGRSPRACRPRACMVMTMPSTAATMPRPGSESPTLSSDARPLALLIVMGVEVGVQHHLEVVGADGAVHEHAERLAREVHGVGPREHSAGARRRSRSLRVKPGPSPARSGRSSSLWPAARRGAATGRGTGRA